MIPIATPEINRETTLESGYVRRLVGPTRRHRPRTGHSSDSSPLIIENALAFLWIRMPPWSISMG